MYKYIIYIIKFSFFPQPVLTGSLLWMQKNIIVVFSDEGQERHLQSCSEITPSFLILCVLV